MNKTRRDVVLKGFTIVELLIVIVVIGILAAITVVAYNGIQSRAYGAKAAATANIYAKALSIYKNTNGYYPDVPPTPPAKDGAEQFRSCLGEASMYPASGEFAAGECDYVKWTGYPDWGVVTDPTVMAAIKTTLSPIPNTIWPSTDSYWTDGASDVQKDGIRGLVYTSYPTNSTTPSTATIVYGVPGTEVCPSGIKTDSSSTDNDTYCKINLN